MNENLKKILETAASGKGDLWRETEVAAKILLRGGYEGHEEDLSYIEDVQDCLELEKVLSQGQWYFQEADTWKYEFCEEYALKNFVFTFAEAAEIWGLSESTLRKAQFDGRFRENETRKSGKIWLVTRRAMERIYGPTPDK
ncbi:helix-turn-helix domain-containing protein [Acetivibrio straminisolvens]|uniref:helix-turn-helix domain-containing protein n=1 Tax=Acetivibrio straminisolvens TaxID=253314 RepID=UPI0022402C7D|nr:helix-turn-helix domain-containing protein [Acetivibrio straminisolvens]